MLASAKRRVAIPASALLGGVAFSAWLIACSDSAPADPGGSSPAGAAGSGGATPAGGAGAGTNSIAGGTPGTGGGLAAGGGGMPSTLAGAGGVAGSANAGSANAGSANAGSANAGSANAGTGGGASEPVTCPSSKLSAGDSDKTINVGGTSRNYVLHVPAAYAGDEPVPLIIDFHPLGGTGGGQRSGSRYPMQTDAEGVIVAFPSGKQGPSGGAWNVGPCCVANVDDVAFAKALVTEISKSACIDPKRVYAAGFSMGGGMSHYVACHAADVFAAVAPAAFDLLEENVDDCKPARPLSVISFRGTSDPVVPYEGGYSAVVQGMPVNFLGAEATFQKWAALNECTGAASAEDAQGCSTYSSCKAGVEVTLCTDEGGGHAQGDASIGWPRLKKYQLP